MSAVHVAGPKNFLRQLSSRDRTSFFYKFEREKSAFQLINHGKGSILISVLITSKIIFLMSFCTNL